MDGDELGRRPEHPRGSVAGISAADVLDMNPAYQSAMRACSRPGEGEGRSGSEIYSLDAQLRNGASRARRQ